MCVISGEKEKGIDDDQLNDNLYGPPLELFPGAIEYIEDNDIYDCHEKVNRGIGRDFHVRLLLSNRRTVSSVIQTNDDRYS
jgi:hypothetical protein